MLKHKFSFNVIAASILIVGIGCKKQSSKIAEQELYRTYCASCHIAPKISELPKDIWEDYVLPDMANRMHIKGLYYENKTDTIGKPAIDLMDWVRLKNFIVEKAPDSLEQISLPPAFFQNQFSEDLIALDSTQGSLFTFLDVEDSNIYYGDIFGTVTHWKYDTDQKSSVYKGNSAITSYLTGDYGVYATEVGVLDPSEKIEGRLFSVLKDSSSQVPIPLKRPVHTLVKDLNKDGIPEFVICEFGNETGQLSLLVKKENGIYQKKILLGLPGSIRTIAKDMNGDDMLDLVTMTTQGNESITILYQGEDLTFAAERAIEFSPVYGSSWFELMDYNQDGFLDFVTVNGDNADKSFVHKPYHGLRIFLNDGKSNFEERYFYPLNGATRFVANDFDQDGDIDFGIISTFPNYKNAPERSFIYLENMNELTFAFKTHTLKNNNDGRWFLMDSGDIDNDGDEDIVLSSFSYTFTPVPKDLKKKWDTGFIDVMVLKNKIVP